MNLLSQFMDSFSTWFLARTDREKVLIPIASIGILLLLTFAVVLKPAYSYRSQGIDEHRYESIGLNWLTDAIEGGLSIDNDGELITNADLMRMITRSAAAYDISFDRQQPGRDGIRVDVRNHSFNEVIRWLHSIGNDHGINVHSANITRRASGLVDARLTLQ